MNKYVLMVSLATLLAACGEKAEQAVSARRSTESRRASPTGRPGCSSGSCLYGSGQSRTGEEAKAAVQAWVASSKANSKRR